MWDDRFEAVIRRFLPFLGPEEELPADADLRDLGLDSMGTVELLASLEDGYAVRFTDEALMKENFATPGAVWETLSAVTPAR